MIGWIRGTGLVGILDSYGIHRLPRQLLLYAVAYHGNQVGEHLGNQAGGGARTKGQQPVTAPAGGHPVPIVATTAATGAMAFARPSPHQIYQLRRGI